MKIESLNSEILQIHIPDEFEVYSGDLKKTPTFRFLNAEKGKKSEQEVLFEFNKEEDKITSITTSCGCTESKIIDSIGKVQKMLVSFKPNGLGEISKVMSIFSNGKKQLIHVKADVRK